jgi:hypothetical protein
MNEFPLLQIQMGTCGGAGGVLAHMGQCSCVFPAPSAEGIWLGN